MKVNSQLTGKGRIGKVVYAQNAGECIAREYRPTISNPNTVGQVAQRAKFKLASQLSSALETSIVIPKKGLVSARNQFVSKAVAQIIVSGGVAQVSYENLQLTAGNAGLPSIGILRVDNNLEFALTEAAGDNISRVVYEFYRKSSENQLIKAGSVIVSEPGVNKNFTGTIPNISGDVVVYAYGMVDKDAAATAKFGNYNIETGADIARLVATRTINSSDYKFTQTRGITLFSEESGAQGSTSTQLYVYIAAGAGGTVSGTGFTNGRKQVTTGDEVTVVATPNSGYHFVGWSRNANGQTSQVSTSLTYTFTVESSNVDLTAVFAADGGGGGGQSGDDI